jgi:outer membrane protein assembly factor BamB
MRITIVCVAVLSLACSLRSASAEEWTRFRGPNGSAVSSETGLPLTWSDADNVAWKAELPGPGSSSPIVCGDRVFVTCYSGYGVDRSRPGDPENLTRHLVCLNLADGKVLWQKPVPSKVAEDPYQGQLTEHGYASSTPVTDGERVFVFFGKSGVLAFDAQGKQLWQTNVGTGSAIMGWGSGVSLVLHKNLVIVNANAESESIVALDKQSGRQLWKAEAKGYSGSWSTPIVVEKPGGKHEVVVFMPGEVWALHPDDGGVLWYCTGLQGAATTSLVANNGIIYATAGGPFGTGSAAIRAGGRNDVTASHVLWKQSMGSYVPSPVVADGHMYWVDDRGTAVCLKADTGKQVYRQRLPGASGVYASPVVADGKLYAVTRRNGTFVLPARPEFTVLAHNRFASDSTDFNASPAVSHKSVLLRSNRFLYCIRGS